MTSFFNRHSDKIKGIFSCIDRLVIQGTFPEICFPGAITNFFYLHRIKIFDFKKWAAPMRDEINENAKQIAQKNSIEIEFIRKNNFRKEKRIKEIISKRGDHPGIVHIFSAMETCTAYKPWHDKKSHKTFFKYDSGRCLHYYFYFIDKDFGLCYFRVPTWAPFRLQFYCNPHNWVARQMDKKNTRFKQVENAFVHIDDFTKAQKLADSFPVTRLHKMIVKYTKAFCPVQRYFASGIHWSVMQVEYATDIIFKDQKTLAPIYEELVRTLSHAVNINKTIKKYVCIFS